MKDKIDFLQKEYLQILSAISSDKKPVFGKMNVHQMIEHMTYAFQLAMGEVDYDYTQPEAFTAKAYQFMMSDKPFRDNTPNAILSDEPYTTTTPDIAAAVTELEKQIQLFIKKYEKEADLKIQSPFFGMLNFNEQVHLLHKHALHHLRQFEALP